MKFLSTIALGVVTLQAGLGLAASTVSMPTCGVGALSTGLVVVHILTFGNSWLAS